jgi:hypothetical protein
MHARRLIPLVLIAFVFTPVRGSGRGAETIALSATGDLQQAIDRAAPGDTIVLPRGAKYTGNFILPLKPGSLFITITTQGSDGLPRHGQRVLPAHAPLLAAIQSPNSQPAIRTAPGAHHWRLQLLELMPTAGGVGDIVTLGDGGAAQVERSQAARDLVIDRCYIHGDAVSGQKRGVALNSGATAITNSYISDVKKRGQDSQAIAGWNGPGPYLIENNYLEAAGENVLFGGADPAIAGLVTEDVILRRNYLTKPVAWRDAGWQVKNLFELKNARRVLVEGNIMEYSWRDGQAGYAILLTPRNQDGRAPWATVEEVTIRHNIIRHAGAGMEIIGEDSDNPSGSTRRVQVVNNLFYDIDADRWGGNGAFALVGQGPSDITIEHNTIIQTGNILMAYGGTRQAPQAILGLRFRDNVVRHNLYGVHGADRAVGQDTLNTFFPGAVFRDNAIAGGDARLYPSGNTFVPADEFDRQFVNPAQGEFTLRVNSRFRGAASDGRDLGVDMNALMIALGLRQPRGNR